MDILCAITDSIYGCVVSHDLIGIFSTTLRELTSNPNMSFEVGIQYILYLHRTDGEVSVY